MVLGPFGSMMPFSGCCGLLSHRKCGVDDCLRLFHQTPARHRECHAILFAAEGDHSESLTIISLIFSMARDGSRPLGQTSVQFMIERQRNSR